MGVSMFDDVEREARHDWLDERPADRNAASHAERVHRLQQPEDVEGWEPGWLCDACGKENPPDVDVCEYCLAERTS